jgi:hypothetical protein
LYIYAGNNFLYKLKPKEIKMKSLIATLITLFAVTAFAAEQAKPTAPAPVATPAVTKADAPAVVKEEAKKPATKSAAKKDDKKATPATATAPAAIK